MGQHRQDLQAPTRGRAAGRILRTDRREQLQRASPGSCRRADRPVNRTGEDRMKMTLLVFVLLAPPLLAHHGTNISYDASKPITMTGTITEFVWQNPHSQVYFDVKSPDGTVVK